MIVHPVKCIFLHIPKNAGTSVEYFFKQKYGHDIQIPEAWNVHYDKISKTQAAEYYIFAIKRNPYTRAVSLWKYWNNWISKWGDKQSNDNIKQIIDVGFDEFWQNYSNVVDCICKNYPWEYKHFIPQTHLNNQPSYVKINKWLSFENLQHDWVELTHELGIEHLPLEHRNKSNTDLEGGSDRYYDNEQTKTIIRDIYKQDFAKLGYEC